MTSCVKPIYKGAILKEWKIKDYCVGLGLAGLGKLSPEKGVSFGIKVGSTDSGKNCQYPRGVPNAKV